ncbi:class I SAM-dependent methyltransferase [Rhodopila sp.]|jgi:SAM-dependent methyltransferase|uniref:class I SAM-dependent methyltransferase n=1 Tax=Rhodopila sp. TaxID=2480087 RepID=UPI002C730E9E|nr:class I SAM-dependent methyltransferase [Rhodopila sp.]HVZ07470.1 class I SAM-dependent methyltransferase [Rhodopila sp.]
MSVVSTAPDYTAIKQRQKTVWSSGDYAIIGTTLQIVGERLCEAVDMRAGSRVLDVAAGNGNATLAAARRFARVTSTDYVGALLEHGKKRAEAEGFSVAFQEADVEALPFADGSFDTALSTFGVMFAPDQEKAASELTRVVRKGGRIGLANWTPDGFIGELLKIVSRYVPRPAGIKPPTLWGTMGRLLELFAGYEIQASEQSFTFRYETPGHWLQTFRSFYGPVNRAFAALDGKSAAALEVDILRLLQQHNNGSGTLIVPAAYLEAVIIRPSA